MTRKVKKRNLISREHFLHSRIFKTKMRQTLTRNNIKYALDSRCVEICTLNKVDIGKIPFIFKNKKGVENKV